MIESVKKTIDCKQITVFKSKTPDVPTVYANMVMDSGQGVLRACETCDCNPFHLVTITKLHWDEDKKPRNWLLFS